MRRREFYNFNLASTVYKLDARETLPKPSTSQSLVERLLCSARQVRYNCNPSYKWGNCVVS